LVRNSLTTLRILSRSDFSELKRQEICDEIQHSTKAISSNQRGKAEQLSQHQPKILSKGDAGISFGRLLVDFTQLLSDVTLDSFYQVLQADYDYLSGNSHAGATPKSMNDELEAKMIHFNTQISALENWLGE